MTMGCDLSYQSQPWQQLVQPEIYTLMHNLLKYEPHHESPGGGGVGAYGGGGGSGQVKHKQACSAKEAGLRLEVSDKETKRLHYLSGKNESVDQPAQ